MHERADRLVGGFVGVDQTLEREFEARLVESSTLAFRIAYSVLRNREDAEDAAQDAFAKAYRNFRQLRDRNRFRAWLARMTWRLAIDRYRTRLRRLTVESSAHNNGGATAAETVEARERAERLWRAIDALPEKLRIVLVLASIEGHEVTEVASLLEIPKGTVKSRLFVARQRLKEQLQCPFIESGDALTGDGLDRELAAALAVEPSAEFLARVRMRIANEPGPPAWRVTRMFAAAGACAVAIAFALSAAQWNRAALPPDADRVPPASRAFADLSLVLPTIVAAPFAGAPLAMAVSTPRRVQKPSPEMQAIMQSNADANTALRAHKKARDYDALVKDAATFKQNFAYIAVFWANQQIDAALTISRRGLTAAMELEAAALIKDDAAVEKALTALTDTCDACHKEHREELQDKTYAIRL